jgi:nitric oxide reductase subunit B
LICNRSASSPIVGSLLPVGLLQTWASVEHGYWYARSSEFLGSPLMQKLGWMCVPGDTLFAIGALVLVAVVFTHRRRKQDSMSPEALPVVTGD